MFPSTCSQLPCMNIDVKTLASTGTWCTLGVDRPVVLVPEQDRVVAVRAASLHLARHEPELGRDRGEPGHGQRARPGSSGRRSAGRVLCPDEDGQVGDDQRQRQDRQVPGGDVVLERDHPGRYRAATESGRVALAAAMRSSARRSAATCGAMSSPVRAREPPVRVSAMRSTLAAGAVGVVRPAELLGDVDHPSGVDHEVGRIDDAAGCAGRLPSSCRAAGCWPRPATTRQRSSSDRLGPDHGAERARREHVALLACGRSSGGQAVAPSATSSLDPLRVDVGDGDLGARVEQVANEARRRRVLRPARPRATPRRSSPSPASAAAARIPQKTPHAVIGEGSPEPPRLDRQAGDVVGLERDDLGVGGARADVLGRQVAAAERVDEPAQRPEQERRLVGARDRPARRSCRRPGRARRRRSCRSSRARAAGRR